MEVSVDHWLAYGLTLFKVANFFELSRCSTTVNHPNLTPFISGEVTLSIGM